MANYDYKLAKKIIDNAKELNTASMGMHEDWFWTAEEVWTADEGYKTDLTKEPEIGGITGSYWATPVLELEFKDGSSRTIKCFTGQTGDELQRIEKQINMQGVLSAPINDLRSEIDLEEEK